MRSEKSFTFALIHDVDSPDQAKFHHRFSPGAIFIYIPKPAGSSTLMTPVYSTKGHKTIRYYERHLPPGKRVPTTFSVVRNPYKRLASGFYYLSKYTKKAYDKHWARKHIGKYKDLNDFVTNGLHRKSILYWIHFKPQASFVCSKNRNIGVDYILRFEKLSLDWLKFAELTGLPKELPVKNATEGGEAVSELNEKSKIKVYSLYHKDFELFGYHK